MDFIIFTPFEKVFLSIMGIKFHYYGLMYSIGFLVGYYFLLFLIKKEKLGVSQEEFEKMFFGIIILGLIGGRIGHILIYNLSYYLSNPLEIFAVWKGGMASHGGMIGGLIGFILFKPKNINYKKILDLVVIPLPIGLFLGRLGNLINGELYGKISSMPWCMYFEDNFCRHPTQIYAMIKDFFIFIIIFYLYKKGVRGGFLASTFLILYGIFRFIVEFFKEETTGNNIFSFITTGQILSIFMILCGIGFFFFLGGKKFFKK